MDNQNFQDQRARYLYGLSHELTKLGVATVERAAPHVRERYLARWRLALKRAFDTQTRRVERGRALGISEATLKLTPAEMLAELREANRLDPPEASR